jgi:hypothetical protein
MKKIWRGKEREGEGKRERERERERIERWRREERKEVSRDKGD